MKGKRLILKKKSSSCFCIVRIFHVYIISWKWSNSCLERYLLWVLQRPTVSLNCNDAFYYTSLTILWCKLKNIFMLLFKAENLESTARRQKYKGNSRGNIFHYFSSACWQLFRLFKFYNKDFNNNKVFSSNTDMPTEILWKFNALQPIFNTGYWWIRFRT